MKLGHKTFSSPRKLLPTAKYCRLKTPTMLVNTVYSALVHWCHWCAITQQVLCCEELNIVRVFTQQNLSLLHLPAVLVFHCGCWKAAQSGLKYGKRNYLSIVILTLCSLRGFWKFIHYVSAILHILQIFAFKD